MPLARTLLALTLSVLVLAGCASPSGPGAVPTLSDERSASPLPTDDWSNVSPEPVPEDDDDDGSEEHVLVGDLPPVYHPDSGYERPEFVFDGDCNAVFSGSQLEGVLGSALEFREGGGYPSLQEFDAVGGLSCVWIAPDYTYVQVDVFPVGAATYKKTIACGVQIYTQIGCDLEATRNGIQLSGGVGSEVDGPDITSAMQKKLINLFLEHATTAMSAPLPPAAPGAWAPRIDCAAIVAAGDYSTVKGLGKGTEGASVGGWGGYISPAFDALSVAHSGPQMEGVPGSCTIGAASFQIYASTRWNGESQLDGTPAGRLSVAGVDEVWTQTYSDITIVDIFEGPNWIQMWAEPGVDVGAVAKQLVAALNKSAIG